MSTHTGPIPACTLTILLSGDLSVCVDDPAYVLTPQERSWGMRGPMVTTRLGMPVHCMCAAWAAGMCTHALDLRALLVATVHTLRGADDVPADQHSATVKRAVAVAHLLVARNPHLWIGMLPGALRPGSPGWGEHA
jgi:hypothetical protein